MPLRLSRFSLSALRVFIVLAASAAAAEPPPFSPPYLPGEEARYAASAGPIGLEIGTAAFTVEKAEREGVPILHLRGRADGSALGFTLKYALTSELDAKTGRPLFFVEEQEGSRRKRRELAFDPVPEKGGAPSPGAGAVRYSRMKHCRSKECRAREHFVPGGGGAPAHCEDCDEWGHFVLTPRFRRELEGPAFDVLSLVYAARGLDLKAGGEDASLDCVNGRKLYRLKVRAEGEEEIEVPAGKFQALKIAFTAEPEGGEETAEKDEPEKFEGPFGLKGDIALWVEKERRFPLRVRGTVPFGINVDVEVNLTHYQAGNAETDPAPKTAPPPPPAGRRRGALLPAGRSAQWGYLLSVLALLLLWGIAALAAGARRFRSGAKPSLPPTLLRVTVAAAALACGPLLGPALAPGLSENAAYAPGILVPALLAGLAARRTRRTA